jgi:uncharacterized hydrophobic protein (TIGR00271 family)
MNPAPHSDAPTPAVCTASPPEGAQKQEVWFTPAFVKGASLFLGGLFVLVTPELTLSGYLHHIAAAVLLMVGCCDLWGLSRGIGPAQDRRGWIGVSISLILGGVLLLWPYMNYRRIVIVLIIYALFRSGLAFWRILTQARPRKISPFLLTQAWANLTFAILFLALPTTMLFLMIVVMAFFSMIAGLVMAVYAVMPHASNRDNALNRAQFVEIFWNWLQVRDVGKERRKAVAKELYFERPDRTHKMVSYSIMLMLSVSVATLAILQDSTAVVIGAMLVAPLMTPIMGCAAGLVAGWPKRIRSTALIILVSMVASIGLAWILASWIPALVPAATNSQVLSRVSPTLLDMAIAIVAGAAGAYATLDNRVSPSLVGVAIAVALVPPLSVIGVTLEAGMFEEALGAFLLFGSNLVSIVLVSTLVFLLIGFTPIRTALKGRLAVGKILTTTILGALVIMIPLGFSGEGLLQKATWREKALVHATEWLADCPDLRVQRVQVRRKNSNVLVFVSGQGLLPSADILQHTLVRDFGESISLTVEYFPTIIERVSAEGGEGKSPKREDGTMPEE